MGSISAMNSIERVMDAHGEELRRALEEAMPQEMRKMRVGVVLEGAIYEIGVKYVFPSGATLDGRSFDIDELAEQFPDCDVAY